MPRKVFGAALALFALMIFPILRADQFYIDDLGRSLNGYLGWGRDARPLANVVMEILNLGTPLVDLSPLPQIAAAGLFAWLAVGFSKRFSLEGAWRAPLALLPLFASPLFLENLSYKFDVLTMSLAVCLSAWSAIAPPEPRKFTALGTLGLIATLCLYQPAISVFAIFAVVEVSIRQVHREPISSILRTVALRMAQFVIALGVYTLTAARGIKGSYGTTHYAIDHGASLLSTVTTNVRASLQYDVSSLMGARNGALLALIAVGMLCMFGVAAVYARLYWSRARVWHRLALIGGVLLVPAAALLAMWGPMLFLTDPVLVPRTQIGVGALGTASAVLLLVIANRIRLGVKWQIAVFLGLSYPMVTFAAVYGNTLSQQKIYEENVSRSLADDLTRVAQSDQVRQWGLVGTAGFAPVARHNASKYPFLTRLVPVYLSQGWGWASDRLAHAGLEMPRIPDESAPRTRDLCSLKPTVIRPDYRLYVAEGIAIVQFEGATIATCDPHDM
jgi:hypothetical protein